jgi:HK97 family phage prohead protease
MTGRPAGEWMLRDARTVAVNYPERTIDLIVMPYDEEALVPYGDRMVYEQIAPGAFAGIQKRANRIRVNRDHKLERTVGRALSFDPDHPDGLFGRIRISRTELGEETLELANDGNLDASAGFLPMPDGIHWIERSRRVRYTKCWLGHIALTPEPAYDGARVLAVRSQQEPPRTPTPNLDRVRADILEARYSRISADVASR